MTVDKLITFSIIAGSTLLLLTFLYLICTAISCGKIFSDAWVVDLLRWTGLVANGVMLYVLQYFGDKIGLSWKLRLCCGIIALCLLTILYVTYDFKLWRFRYGFTVSIVIGEFLATVFLCFCVCTNPLVSYYGWDEQAVGTEMTQGAIPEEPQDMVEEPKEDSQYFEQDVVASGDIAEEEPEVQMPEGIPEDAIYIDENMNVVDGSGNYLGKCEEMYPEIYEQIMAEQAQTKQSEGQESIEGGGEG